MLIYIWSFASNNQVVKMKKKNFRMLSEDYLFALPWSSYDCTVYDMHTMKELCTYKDFSFCKCDIEGPIFTTYTNKDAMLKLWDIRSNGDSCMLQVNEKNYKWDNMGICFDGRKIVTVSEHDRVMYDIRNIKQRFWVRDVGERYSEWAYKGNRLAYFGSYRKKNRFKYCK